MYFVGGSQREDTRQSNDNSYFRSDACVHTGLALRRYNYRPALSPYLGLAVQVGLLRTESECMTELPAVFGPFTVNRVHIKDSQRNIV